MKRRLALVTAVIGLFGVVASAQAGLIQFQSPSKNIGCIMGGQFVRCDIREHDWVAPPKPANCELDWGGGVAVDKKGKAGYVCAGDTALNNGRILGFGEKAQNGRFRCRSSEAGVKCLNTKNKHGFKLSREAVTLF